VTQADSFQDDLDELWRNDQLLAGKVEPAQGHGGRRPQPASRPPLQVGPVSVRDETRREVRHLIAMQRWELQPATRVNITTSTKTPELPNGARCPWCQGELVAWFYGDQPEPPEVVCSTPNQHTEGEPWRWEKDQWGRLGVSTGVRVDARYGARPPGVVAG
jgi:hypothetical protein